MNNITTDNKAGTTQRELARELSRIVNTTVEEGKTNTPPIGLIEDVLGAEFLEPTLLALATSYRYERRTGHPEARHPIDASIRDLAWPADWHNTTKTRKTLLFHDSGESVGTIA